MIEVGLISDLSKAKQKNSFQQWKSKSHPSLFSQLILILTALLSITGLSYAAEVTLAWNSSNQASGYILYYGLESRTYENMIDVGDNLQHTVTNLNENQRYYFAVSAYNDFDESEYSDEISYRTDVNTGNEPPIADAGADQSADEADTVILDGSYSSDPDDGIATYQWEQIEGTVVELSDASAIEPSLICPAVGSNGDTLVFRLTVTDYSGVTASDTVKIYVNGEAETPQNNQGADYCDSSSQITNEVGIGNVTLGQFSNSSTTSATGYSDFTSEVIKVEKGGKSYQVSLSTEQENLTEWKYWRVWADLNHDGDFDDSGEKLLEYSKKDTIIGLITFPTAALEGDTRLRISMGLQFPPPPCGYIYNGEVEDYTLRIVGQETTEEEQPTSGGGEQPTSGGGVDVNDDPVPTILANGSSAGLVFSKRDTPTSIKLGLDSADYYGEKADWYLLVKTPTGEWYYFDYSFSQWRYAGSRANISTTHQGPLFDLAPTDICVVDISNLSGGKYGIYTFYFGVDLVLDGSLDMDAWHSDSVRVYLYGMH